MWKPIEGYEGRYEVSNLGRVRSIDMIISTGNESYNRSMLYKGRILKGSLSCNGYVYITLSRPGRNILKKYVHRLVAEAFLPNPNNYRIVNHKDENKKNNVVENLEWCTHKYNVNYGTGISRSREKLLNNKKWSKKIAQYTLDGELVRTYPSLHEMFRVTNFPRCNIKRCCEGRGKQRYGYIWRYV